MDDLEVRSSEVEGGAEKPRKQKYWNRRTTALCGVLAVVGVIFLSVRGGWFYEAPPPYPSPEELLRERVEITQEIAEGAKALGGRWQLAFAAPPVPGKDIPNFVVPSHALVLDLEAEYRGPRSRRVVHTWAQMWRKLHERRVSGIPAQMVVLGGECTDDRNALGFAPRGPIPETRRPGSNRFSPELNVSKEDVSRAGEAPKWKDTGEVPRCFELAQVVGAPADTDDERRALGAVLVELEKVLPEGGTLVLFVCDLAVDTEPLGTFKMAKQCLGPTLARLLPKRRIILFRGTVQWDGSSGAFVVGDSIIDPDVKRGASVAPSAVEYYFDPAAVDNPKSYPR